MTLSQNQVSSREGITNLTRICSVLLCSGGNSIQNRIRVRGSGVGNHAGKFRNCRFFVPAALLFQVWWFLALRRWIFRRILRVVTAIGAALLDAVAAANAADADAIIGLVILIRLLVFVVGFVLDFGSCGLRLLLVLHA